jgi:uncharacterized protein
MELTDAETAELNRFLARVEGGKIANSEALDGFFAALACCPDMILPSEYLPVIQGGATEAGDLVFEDMAEAQRFIALVTRCYNHVNDQLRGADGYLPLVLEDEAGAWRGNDWAKGFLAGTQMRFDIWSEIVNSEEHGGPMVPIFALAYENDPDPAMRPFEEPIDADKREQLLVSAAAGVMRMHRFFLERRADYAPDGGTFVRQGGKTGRNDPCPCGSGRKFKQCCGNQRTLH